MSDYRRHKIPTGHFWCVKCDQFTMHFRKLAEMGRGECEKCRKRRVKNAQKEK